MQIKLNLNRYLVYDILKSQMIENQTYKFLKLLLYVYPCY